VYKNVGGFAYGWFISGPIGAILSRKCLAQKPRVNFHTPPRSAVRVPMSAP